MDKFISMLCNGEFWVGLALCFLVSLVLAVIAQDIWDNLRNISVEEYDIDELEVIDLDVEIGDTVYDTLNRRVGIYCGSNGDYAVVLMVLDSRNLYYYYPLFNSLIKLQE